MTTYAYKCVFNDTETIALDAAIKMYSEYCKEQIKNGNIPPHLAHLDSMESIKEKVYANIVMTSTSSFCK